MIFKWKPFKSHAGLDLQWKIDCDSLTDEDWDCMAKLVHSMGIRFHDVMGVPQGGLKFAKALKPYCEPDPELHTLLVDDVFTTGASIEEVRHEHCDKIGQAVVLFARGPCPWWVIPIFNLNFKAMATPYQPLPYVSEREQRNRVQALLEKKSVLHKPTYKFRVRGQWIEVT